MIFQQSEQTKTASPATMYYQKQEQIIFKEMNDLWKKTPSSEVLNYSYK